MPCTGAASESLDLNIPPLRRPVTAAVPRQQPSYLHAEAGTFRCPRYLHRATAAAIVLRRANWRFADPRVLARRCAAIWERAVVVLLSRKSGSVWLGFRLRVRS